MSKIYTVLEVRVLNKTNKLSNKNVSKLVKSKQHAGVAIARTFGGLLRPIYLVVSSSFPTHNKNRLRVFPFYS